MNLFERLKLAVWVVLHKPPIGNGNMLLLKDNKPFSQSLCIVAPLERVEEFAEVEKLLMEFAPIKSVSVTCRWMPVQIEGELHTGDYFYFGARHTSVTLGYGSSLKKAMRSIDYHLTFGTQHEAGYLPLYACAGMLMAWIEECTNSFSLGEQNV